MGRAPPTRGQPRSTFSCVGFDFGEWTLNVVGIPPSEQKKPLFKNTDVWPVLFKHTTEVAWQAVSGGRRRVVQVAQGPLDFITNVIPLS